MKRTQSKRQTSNKKKIIISSLLILLMVLGGAVTFGFLYIKNQTAAIIKPIEGQKPITEIKKDEDYLVNFLLVGVDNDSEREKTGLEGMRTDSLMIVSLNTKSEEISVYSIPRDTATALYDKDKTQLTTNGKILTKINESYDNGGITTTISTIEELFQGITIDYYGIFNFISFKGIVDSLGGIDLNVPTDIYDYKLEKILVEAGQQTLNGTQALDVARARYQDNDIERGYRQQLVMESILKKTLSSASISNILSIFNSVKGNVETNLSLSDMKELFNASSGKDFKINKIESDWSSFNLNGESMVFLNREQREKVVREVNESIEMEPSENLTENNLNSSLDVFESDYLSTGQLDFSSSDIDSLFIE